MMGMEKDPIPNIDNRNNLGLKGMATSSMAYPKTISNMSKETRGYIHRVEETRPILGGWDSKAMNRRMGG